MRTIDERMLEGREKGTKYSREDNERKEAGGMEKREIKI
jgi:hypothetical protein